ncbi:hypothetical protein LZ30DRAFT_826316 [Colletotrichum cereale]|nr:hypothetical protein LZ30DRAFT_826316 [Colletotrichum cereale]
MASNPTELDKRGDLVLRLSARDADSDPEPPSKDLRVCSRTMARASVVFEKMLFGPFKESQKKGEDWVVELPKDNIQSMTVILAIAHGCRSIVPDHVTIPELFELLVVGDKYSMAHLLHPYLRRWVPKTKNVVLDDDTLMLAWIAREVGAKKLFETAIIEIAKHCHNGGEAGSLVRDNDRRSVFNSANAHIRAAGILDVVAVTHMDVLKGVLKPLREVTSQTLDGRGCKAYSSQNDEVQICANSILGSLIRSCNLLGIDPGVTCLTDALSTYPHSAYQVCWVIQVMRCDNIPYHDDCDPMRDIQRDTRRAFSDAAVTMSPSEQEHFRKQAEISGWDETD